VNLLTIVHNQLGVRFNVRLVKKGDRYGLDNCLVHEKDEPIVEFYDARHPHTEYGQFITRYAVSSLRGTDEWSRRAHWPDLRTHGLDLMGHVAAWKLEPENVREVLRALDFAGIPKEET
jgi:hypothetical protein